jgi:type II secretion system protein I
MIDRDSATGHHTDGKMPRFRRGLSLLEVILALTILALALAALGELVALGTRSGASARDVTRAQLLCESKMAELTTTSYPISSEQLVEFEYDPEWAYSVDVQPIDTGTLLSVTVTVEQIANSGRRPTSYSLTRWIPDPEIEWPETFEELYGIEQEALEEQALR